MKGPELPAVPAAATAAKGQAAGVSSRARELPSETTESMGRVRCVLVVLVLIGGGAAAAALRGGSSTATAADARGEVAQLRHRIDQLDMDKVLWDDSAPAGGRHTDASAPAGPAPPSPAAELAGQQGGAAAAAEPPPPLPPPPLLPPAAAASAPDTPPPQLPPKAGHEGADPLRAPLRPAGGAGSKSALYGECDALDSINRRPSTICVEDTVEVVQDIAYDGAVSYRLKAGMQGEVVTVDDSRDMQITFDALRDRGPVWVLRADRNKLRVVPASGGPFANFWKQVERNSPPEEGRVGRGDPVGAPPTGG